MPTKKDEIRRLKMQMKADELNKRGTTVKQHPRKTRSGRTTVKRHKRNVKTRGELQDEWRELNRDQDRKYQLYRNAVNTYDPKLTAKQSADRIAKREKAWENAKQKSAQKLAETETAPIRVD